MTRKLAVFGASHFMVLKLLDAINRQELTWELVGFLDDAPERQGQSHYGYQVLGCRSLLPKLTQAGVWVFNNVIGHWTRAKAVAELLETEGCQVPNLVDPGIDMAYVEIGKGCLLSEACVVGSGSTIGNFVTVRLGSVISHDVRVEDYVVVGPGVTVAGKASLGKACFIGAGATILPEINIGEQAIVGAGAVVTKDVPANTTVAGVPARILPGKA